MKHSIKITAILVLLFLITQLVGLAIVEKYFDRQKTAETGVPTYSDLPYGMTRPDLPANQALIVIIISVLIGTGLVFLLMRFRQMNMWKIWFFLSALLCMSVAFSAFIQPMAALVFGVILAAFKVFRPNVFVQNFTELFIYGGLAAVFVPILNLFAVFVLLILISIYDMYAVWKSRHMIKLAEFQTESKVFAGMMIPYELNKAKETKAAKQKTSETLKVKTAILGGGDIAFPLIFAGVVMQQFGFLQAAIISAATTIALAVLLFKGEKGQFYPAMPFLSAGCFAGYALILLINFLL